MSRCLVRGSINVDEYFHVKDIVRPGETISSTDLDKRPGGKGANQSVALARAGSCVDLVGAVGTDGEWVLSSLKSVGVGVEETVILDDVPSGRALIQLTERGQNSIILFKGANYARPRDKLEVTFRPGTTHLLLQNEIDLPETLAWLSAASARQISTIFNPSPMLTNTELESFPWKQLNWLIINEGEASDLHNVLSGAATVPTFDRSDEAYTRLESYSVVKALSPLIPGISIVCTLGEDGVLAFIPWLNDFIYLPAVECDVRDTTGAGDCFTGYLVSGLMRTGKKDAKLTRDEISDILKVCVQASGMCVEKRGTLESIPRREEVQARFNTLS